MQNKIITILGPTACGKTRLAVMLADKINAEIISADSRQIYKGMDLGTGKDLEEYRLGDKYISYHLIDIVEAGSKYNLHAFVKDFEKAHTQITKNEKKTILCGGSGMYIEAVLKGYSLVEVPENRNLRNGLEEKNDKELIDQLCSMKKLHNTTDLTERSRLIRAIEIETFYQENNISVLNQAKYDSLIFGVHYPRETIRKRITERLKQRLEQGMIEEVAILINKGVSPDTLKYYGLEYKFITQYLLKELDYNAMFRLLNTAIHQFAKRQMTWFRRMEKQGFCILWIDGHLQDDEKIDFIVQKINM